MNQLIFTPIKRGDERKFTHVLEPDGSVHSEGCGYSFTDVLVGVFRGPEGITIPQAQAISRMEAMALLLSKNVTFLFNGALGADLDAVRARQYVPVCQQCWRAA